MKRCFVILLLFSALWPLGAREVYNINRDWKFFSASEGSSDAAEVVNLPHMWNYDALGGKRNYFQGVGNYQKEITVPASWQNKRIFIRGYGGNSVTNVMVNGRHVGEHLGGYTAFAYEITDYIAFGRQNSFWIIVNNAPRLDVLPTAGDANSYGGLFRDVELIVADGEMVSVTDNASDGIYVAQKSVSRQKVSGEAVVKVSGVRDNVVQAMLSIYTDAGDTVATAAARVRLSGRTISTANIPFSFENPRLWNGTANPFMYNVTVKIVSNGRQTDEQTVRTGFRFVSVDRVRGFLLNGEPYPVRGVSVRQDRAMKGNAITSYQVEEDFDLICGMGVNTVRVANVPHNPEFYRLCDQKGIMVWSDFPMAGAAYLTDKPFVETASFRANALAQSTEIIRQQFNHPCVVMWGIFSNLNMRGDDPLSFLTLLNSTAKREDPSRLTVAMSNEDGGINFITDLIVWDHNFGWKQGQPSDISIWREQFRSGWQNLRSGVNYGAGASIFHQDERLERPDPEGNWHPERWQTHLHYEYLKNLQGDPLFWGIFAGNMFDYGAAGRTWGEGNGINDSGLVTFDRKYRKDAYYLYKANWNTTEPFVYIAERRWAARNQKTQNIMVFSNNPQVELIVNGVSQGEVAGYNGRFDWLNIALEEGENTITARSGEQTDTIKIRVLNSSGQSDIN